MDILYGYEYMYIDNGYIWIYPYIYVYMYIYMYI